jgi:broad specificity phosphatase PhoE
MDLESTLDQPEPPRGREVYRNMIQGPIQGIQIAQTLPLLIHPYIFRAEVGLPEGPGGACTTPTEGGIWLFRHTSTRSHGQEMFTGINTNNENGKISLKGYRRAFITAQKMHEQGLLPDGIISSNLHRASLTARMISFLLHSPWTFLENQVTVERNFGEYDGASRSAINSQEKENIGSLHPSSFHKQTGVEPLGMFCLRAAANLVLMDLYYQEYQKHIEQPCLFLMTHGGLADAIDIVLRQLVALRGDSDLIRVKSEAIKPGMKLPEPYADYYKGKGPEFAPILKLNPLDGIFIPESTLKLIRSKHSQVNRYKPLRSVLEKLEIGNRPDYKEFPQYEYLKSIIYDPAARLAPGVVERVANPVSYGAGARPFWLTMFESTYNPVIPQITSEGFSSFVTNMIRNYMM